ncbi:hypothetical protein DM02DRAFT_609258 [Periconia macrospinosa]|uniref:Calponin-homology (CH) domain-containing protein n=1 Tax=Periconia macrospinosa TaxID=97972 RepID=A0A2V1E8K0_9PLEO|nr:hypothetical protein DM02DRAFT_609258 [Periconia macrospinosa]
MRRYAESTPCPSKPSFAGRHSSSLYNAPPTSNYADVYAYDDGTTANIEYTTEVKPSASTGTGLRNVKPKRPPMIRKSIMAHSAMGTRGSFEPSLDIFEDVALEEEEAELQRAQRGDAKATRRSTTRERGALRENGTRASTAGVGTRIEKKTSILARGAQKIHLPAPAPPVTAPAPAPEVRETRPQRHRVSQLLTERQSAAGSDATVQLREDLLEKREMRRQGPAKDSRRNTIYIPSDETSIFTIHPGNATQAHKSRNPRQKSPDIGLDLVTLSEEEPENLVSVLKKERKSSRKSLAAPPKRVPLVHAGRQGSSFSHDVFGQGGGKENVPPGMEVYEGKNGATHIELNFGKLEEKKPAVKPAKVHFSSKGSEASSKATTRKEGTQKRTRTSTRYDESSPAKALKTRAGALASSTRPAAPKPNIKNVKSRINKTAPRLPLSSSSPFHTDRSPPTALRRQRVERTSTHITLMHEVGRPQQPPKEEYSVLTEDLARPELYEDNWLTYQEVAITQILNSMFEASSKDPNAEQTSEELRRRLLDMYQEPAMLSLHKRLQASLQYGALSIPKDLLVQTSRLKDDVGLRKRFLNLWVKTYNLTTLRTAAETIIGRQITAPSRLSSGSTSSDDGSRVMRAERRAIEKFLDVFLIRNEDAVRVKSAGVGSIASLTRGDQSNDDFGSQGWSWRRTALRSLMLIYLLDRAKSADMVSGCLFQSTSPHKTSTDVLHALSTMLLPSHGDITRPLGHLNYKVDHAQYPLQEFTYHIDNIAIDLRDGVILTRLVELLLYQPSTLAARQEDTVTINMPTGDTLTSSFDLTAKESWVLSQHLKVPSIGRAQKLYNVQVALAALDGVRGIPLNIVGGIKPEDVVDGHREKTMSLLWSLVGKHGLHSLVDWTGIVREIQRFRSQWYKRRNEYEDGHLDSEDDDKTEEIDVGSDASLKYHTRLLLSWARCIARTKGLKVSNLTTSFSNPKIVEAIVDAYLPPTFLPPSSSSSELSLASKLAATGCSTSFISLFTSSKSKTPHTIPSKDFTLLTLTFLASRLPPLSLTHRAATTLQRAYRAHLTRRTISSRISHMRVARAAADVGAARERLVRAAIVVQRRWREIEEMRMKRLEGIALAVQSWARAWVVRRWAGRVTGGRVGGGKGGVSRRRVRGGW